MLISLLGIAVTLGVAILVHEAGHFAACRYFKVKVERFAIGFGPKLVGISDKQGTEFVIRAIPLGGYVKMAGELVEDIKGEPDEYFSKPWWQRSIISFSGPFMNYVTAVIIFAGVYALIGIPKLTNIIGSTVPGMPAQVAGVLPGDVVTQLDNVKIETWEAIAGYIHSHGSKDIVLKVNREGKELVFKLTPKFDATRNAGLVGISPKQIYQKSGFFAACASGVRNVYEITKLTIKTLALSIIKLAKPEIAGPIGIAQFAASAAKSGVYDFLMFIALISTGIGLFNLLPIPIVDGGQIVIFLIEGITRKRATLEQLKIVNMAGIFIVLFIFVIATYNDIQRIVVGAKVKKEGQQSWSVKTSSSTVTPPGGKVKK